jgi:hypothetical protein
MERSSGASMSGKKKVTYPTKPSATTTINSTRPIKILMNILMVNKCSGDTKLMMEKTFRPT